jgi:hypothetical protein
MWKARYIRSSFNVDFSRPNMSCASHEIQLHSVKNHFQPDINKTRKFEYYEIVASTGEPPMYIHSERKSTIFVISIALLWELSCDCFRCSLRRKLSVALLYGLKRPYAFSFSFFCLDGNMWLFGPMALFQFVVHLFLHCFCSCLAVCPFVSTTDPLYKTFCWFLY